MATQAWLLDTDVSEGQFALEDWTTLNDTVMDHAMARFFVRTKRHIGDSVVVTGLWVSEPFDCCEEHDYATMILSGELTLWPDNKPRFILDPDGKKIVEHG